MRLNALAALGAALAALPVQAAASDDRPRPRGATIQALPSAPVDAPREPRLARRRTLFVNRVGGLYQGTTMDDSTRNDSTVVYPMPSAYVSPFHLGDAEWQQVMTCTRLMFSRFALDITDVDPGDVPHIECVVGGEPGDVGWPMGYGGVAPIPACTDDAVERAIVFVFSEVFGDNVQVMCEVVAQEVGHALGLDHELLCEDPMTYLYGCGAKTFQDVDAPCGEDEARPCFCDVPTQNSVQHLLSVLGPADQTPPTVSITAPADGARVPLGFVVEVAAADDLKVAKVELFVDEVYIAGDALAPYALVSPVDLALGPHTLMARAQDNGGNLAIASITVEVTPACSQDSECEVEGWICERGGCVGGLGARCDDGDDCSSGLCAGESGLPVCTMFCDETTACPDGFSCTSPVSGGLPKCFRGGGGIAGCRMTRRGEPPLAVTAALLVCALIRRRRAAN